MLVPVVQETGAEAETLMSGGDSEEGELFVAVLGLSYGKGCFKLLESVGVASACGVQLSAIQGWRVGAGQPYSHGPMVAGGLDGPASHGSVELEGEPPGEDLAVLG